MVCQNKVANECKKNRIFSLEMNILLNLKEDFASGPICVSQTHLLWLSSALFPKSSKKNGDWARRYQLRILFNNQCVQNLSEIGGSMKPRWGACPKQVPLPYFIYKFLPSYWKFCSMLPTLAPSRGLTFCFLTLEFFRQD